MHDSVLLVCDGKDHKDQDTSANRLSQEGHSRRNRCPVKRKTSEAAQEAMLEAERSSKIRSPSTYSKYSPKALAEATPDDDALTIEFLFSKASMEPL